MHFYSGPPMHFYSGVDTRRSVRLKFHFGYLAGTQDFCNRCRAGGHHVAAVRFGNPSAQEVTHAELKQIIQSFRSMTEQKNGIFYCSGSAMLGTDAAVDDTSTSIEGLWKERGIAKQEALIFENYSP